MRFCAFAAVSDSLTVVLAENDQLISEITLFQIAGNHFTLLQQLLDISGWTFADLDFAGIVQHSFGGQNPTKLKPCFKVAEQLQLPVVSVLAVDTWAWLAQEYDGEVIVIEPAQEKYWMVANYIWNKSHQCPLCLKPPRLTEPQELIDQLAGRKEPFLLAGEALAASKNSLKTGLNDQAIFFPTACHAPSPHHIVQAVWHRWQRFGPEKTPFSLYSTQLNLKESQRVGKTRPKHNSPPESFEAQSRIRPMREEDLKQVMKIELRSFPSPWSPLAFISELRYNDDAYYYSLIDQNRVIGYIGLWLVLDKGYLVKIAISPEHRRQGWGKYLIHTILREHPFNKLAEISLELRRSNQAAYRFYRSLGFKESGILPNYYENPAEDAVIMSFHRQNNKQGRPSYL